MPYSNGKRCRPLDVRRETEGDRLKQCLSKGAASGEPFFAKLDLFAACVAFRSGRTRGRGRRQLREWKRGLHCTSGNDANEEDRFMEWKRAGGGGDSSNAMRDERATAAFRFGL